MKELFMALWGMKCVMDNFWTETFKNFIATIYSDGSINWMMFFCWGTLSFLTGGGIARTIEYFNKPRR